MSKSLQEAAQDRKERLVALRKRKAGELQDQDSQDSQDFHPDQNGENDFIIKHRNYDPDTGGFKQRTKQDEEMTETIEHQVENITEDVLAHQDAIRNEDLDISTLAPKRPNWDLKRDMQLKLTQLEKATNSAIAILLRKRLLAEKDTGSLSAAVTYLQEAD